MIATAAPMPTFFQGKEFMMVKGKLSGEGMKSSKADKAGDTSFGV